jgi:hypothetical protein
MPSIAERSPTGEERVAHTGSAVTRPTASANGTVIASSRCGHDAAAHVSIQVCRAASTGTSLMNGLSDTSAPTTGKSSR